MEISWNFVSLKKWEPWVYILEQTLSLMFNYIASPFLVLI